MDEQDREIHDRISRRRMIKRLGAATAVAWTAPVLSTLGSPAYAQGSPPPPGCPSCVPIGATLAEHCNNRPDCPPMGQGPCDCQRTNADTCFCTNCTCCDQTIPCAQGCPSGWQCALNCCSVSNTDFLCVPPCGVQPDPACTPLCGGQARTAVSRKTTRG